MKKLLRYMKNYIKECIFAPLFKMIEAGFELIVPLVIAAIIDNGIADKNLGYIGKMCVILVVLGVVGLVISITAQYFSAKAAVGFATEVRHSLFTHIQSLSYTELDTLGSSTLITRITSDVNQVQNGVNLTLRLLLRSPFVVFGAMVMAFTINGRISLIFLVTIAALSIAVFGIMIVTIPLYRDVQGKLDGVTELTRENLTGVRVLRAFCMEKHESQEFSRRNRALTDMQKFVGRISAVMNPLTYVLVNLAIVWLIYSGAIHVNEGSITQGEVVALYNYMAQILTELVKLANLIISITKAVACGNRIQSVFETESGEQNEDNVSASDENILNENDLNGENEYAVEFNHVGLTYKGAGDCSLHDIDFKVKKGETVGIIGGTGSGKTSLVNLIPAFYPATEGQIAVDGRDVRDYDVDELRAKIGVVPQKAALFSGTIRENLLWGNENAGDDRLNAALETAQAAEIVRNKENGLDYILEQNGGNLSGGQKQRLTIARALVRQPEILILDDSASALDMATDAKLRKALKKLDNTTTFIVSQRASGVKNADKIIVLDDGKIAGIGTHDKLLESCGIYKEIWDSQNS
ncbi:MAG: ABC transporter ATP-binding protein/permease [Clostridiales bacterium]|nr:ABC transporter ATP-binding protein/permease [Clostridiales bacterium]